MAAGQTIIPTLVSCHRIPERCFHVRGKPMPVCSRCLGVGVGQSVALIAVLAGLELPYTVAVALAVPMMLDWGLQMYLHVMSTNVRRFATGVMGGFGAATVLLRLLIACVFWLVNLLAY